MDGPLRNPQTAVRGTGMLDFSRPGNLSLANALLQEISDLGHRVELL